MTTLNPITLDTLAESISWAGQCRRGVWDSLWQRKPIGRIAIGIIPGEERIEAAKKICGDLQLEESTKPAGWCEEWRSALLDDLATLYATAQVPGDNFLALNVPRFVHGQSQGMCDIFGVKVEDLPDGAPHVYPLPPDPKQVDMVQPRPLQESMYWGGVAYVRWARAATGERFSFRMPVMTGPFDTANYLLGTTTLCEWVYAHPDIVHRLMDKIMQINIEFIHMLQQSAGGIIHPGSCSYCTRGGYDLCSECRSIVSLKIYEEFEAPRLRRIGEDCGPYGIHACGSWERTVPSAIADPNLRLMNGQSKENDLAKLCSVADGRITFSMSASGGLDEMYCWPDCESFYTHVLDTVPPTQPLEIFLDEKELPLWNRLCEERGFSTYMFANGDH